MKFIILTFFSLFLAFQTQAQFHTDTIEYFQSISDDSLEILRSEHLQKITRLDSNGDTIGYRMCEPFMHVVFSVYLFHIEHGYNKIYYQNSKLAEEGFYHKKNKKTIKQGYFISYYENGNKKEEGAFVKGKKDGLWKEYYESGIISSELVFKRDRLNGYAIEYYESGIKKAEGSYITDQKLTGFFVRFAHGRRIRKTGVWKYFDENGIIIDQLEWTKHNHTEMSDKERLTFPNYYRKFKLD